MSRVRRAFVMASLEQYLALAINFAMVAVLSRLLAPSEIGLAVVGLGISIVAFSLREFATAEFLIQTADVAPDDIRTSRTILVGLTTVIASCLVLAAPLAEQFYDAAGLRPFLYLMATAALLEAAAAPAIALMRREMEFGAIARVRILSLGTMALVTISLAYAGFGFMSYAWGSLGSLAVTLALSIAARPDAFDVRPSLRRWRKVFDFGRFRGAAGLVDRVYDAIPQLVLGRFMPMASVGLYNRMNAVCAIPDRLLLGAVFAIAFPTLAERARKGKDIGDTYLRAIGLITAVYWPALLLLALLAHPVVEIILGASWIEIVPLVRIVAIASLFFFPAILTGPILMATGHNRSAFSCAALSRVFSATVLCTASVHGLTVMAASQFIAIPGQMIFALWFVRRSVSFPWTRFSRVISHSAMLAAGSLAVPLLYVSWADLRLDFSIPEAMAIAVMSGLCWLASAYLLRHPVLSEIWRLAASLRNGAASDPPVPPTPRLSGSDAAARDNRCEVKQWQA